MAIAESHVIKENREYLISQGVDLNALESASSDQKANQRSTTTLLVKNLPHETIEQELESMFSRYNT